MGGSGTFLDSFSELADVGCKTYFVTVRDIEQLRRLARDGHPEYVILAGDRGAEALGSIPVCFTPTQTLIGVRGVYSPDGMLLYETLGAAPVRLPDIDLVGVLRKAAESLSKPPSDDFPLGSRYFQ
jgi:hypothetical protein